MTSFAGKVKAKLDAERDLARIRIDDLKSAPLSETPNGLERFFRDVRFIFHDLKPPPKVPLSNIPQSSRQVEGIRRPVDLIPHLILEHAPILDIEPLSPTNFEKQFGVRVEDVVRLARNGHVFPNLYVRNHHDWAEHEHLSELVDHSISLGTRVDEYFEWVAPTYQEKLPRKIEEVRRIVVQRGRENPEELKRLDAVSRNKEDGTIKVLATNWNYFETLGDPTVVDSIEYELRSRPLDTALRRLFLKKNLMFGRITAAPGGTYYFGKSGIEELRNIEQLSENWARETGVTDAAVWLARKFLRLEEKSFFTDVQFDKLQQCLESPDFQQIKSEYIDASTYLTSRVAQGLSEDRAFTEFELRHKELIRCVSAYRLLARGAASVMGATAGYLGSLSLGAVLWAQGPLALLGGLVGIVLPNSTWSAKSGETLLRWSNAGGFRTYSFLSR